MQVPTIVNARHCNLAETQAQILSSFHRVLAICLIAALSFLMLTIAGCGVKTRMIGSLSLSASTQALAPSQTVRLALSGANLNSSTIDLTASCKASSCGTLTNYQYTAPSHVSAPLTITITAVNADLPAQSASTTLTVYPAPAISSVTPDQVIAGTPSRVVISGSGFAPGSTVSISDEENGPTPALSKVVISDSDTITATVGVPSGASGLFSMIVKSPVHSIQQAQSQNIYIYPSQLAERPSLPVLNVLSYKASGSAATYSCSGSAGSTSITCAGTNTDFLPGEGIRIVGAGNTPAIPSVPFFTITEHDAGSTATHTYCYIVFAADAAGGITDGSGPSCATQESATLSYTGTYNTFSGLSDIPLATFLWYRSEDGGPYQLFAVNGTMDVGQQPRSFGGWPMTLPSDTDDISKHEDLFARVISTDGNRVILDRPLRASIDHALVDHDDSAAIQNAINVGATMGGAEIYLPSGTYNLRRPQFQGRPDVPGPYFSYTTDYNFNHAYVWSPWYFLTIPPGSKGDIHFVGSGSSTIVHLPPNSGGWASMLGFDPTPHPAYDPFKAYGIEPANQGATEVTLTSAPPSTIKPGTDIWIYGGSFYFSEEPACLDTSGTAGGNCHHSELNTVVSVEGRTLQLKYPLSKKYYDDGYNSFGIVPLPNCVHNISLEDLDIDANNRIIGVDILYGLLVNHVAVHGHVAGGVFGGGPKRDIVIENSSWDIGEGDTSWLGTSEYDQEVGVALVHDDISGLAAVGAEGPSMNARLYLTEGTSDIYILNNIFNHVSVYIQESADDYIEHNKFQDGNVAIGYAYVPNEYPHNLGSLRNVAFLSFGPQGRAAIVNNTLNFSSNFAPPWAIEVGHYQDAVVANNTVNVAGHLGGGAAIMAYSGSIENNKVSIDDGRKSTVAVLAVPDFGPDVPFSSLDIKDNDIYVNGDATSLGIGIVGPSVLDAQQVCVSGNKVDVGVGKAIYVWGAKNIALGCN